MARKILGYDGPNLESPAQFLLEDRGYGVLPARGGAAGRDQAAQFLSVFALIDVPGADFGST